MELHHPPPVACKTRAVNLSPVLNLVERFFALITADAIRRGVFTSVAELEATIAGYLTNHNTKPTPFVWTKSADVILAKVNRARATLAAVKTRNQSLESVH